MREETRRVLEMLSQGKITVDEADQLLNAVGAPSVAPDDKKSEPRYLKIQVNQAATEGKKAETVNIRVPMTVVRGGLRLGSVIPGFLAKKKVRLQNGEELDLSKVHFSEIESMIRDIGELTVEVDGGDKQVRIRCE
jgi:hypothetical protein